MMGSLVCHPSHPQKEALAENGYYFCGWQGKKTSNSVLRVTPTKDIDLEAIFCRNGPDLDEYQ